MFGSLAAALIMKTDNPQISHSAQMLQILDFFLCYLCNLRMN